MKPSAYISSFAVLAVYATLPGPFTNAQQALSNKEENNYGSNKTWTFQKIQCDANRWEGSPRRGPLRSGIFRAGFDTRPICTAGSQGLRGCVQGSIPSTRSRSGSEGVSVTSQALTSHSPAPKGSVVELSVYSTKYHNRKTRWGYRYDHYKGYTCASNNPAHKLKTIRFTWKGKTLDVFCNDTGGDKQLGYSRMDLSGAAMKFFVPKWNGRDKGAPLLKGAKVEVVK